MGTDFDIKKLFDFSITAIEDFASQHPDEKFHALQRIGRKISAVIQLSFYQSPYLKTD